MSMHAKSRGERIAALRRSWQPNRDADSHFRSAKVRSRCHWPINGVTAERDFCVTKVTIFDTTTCRVLTTRLLISTPKETAQRGVRSLVRISFGLQLMGCIVISIERDRDCE